MKGFISYSREDNLLVTPLIHDLGKLGHEVWMDKELYGGQDWWDEILRQIAVCEFFVLALSPKSLASGPCQLELAYADSLRRPFLPVAIAPVDSNVFPPEIAHAQYVDYSAGDKEALLGLVGTVARLPPAPALPDPMPSPPAMPVPPLYYCEQRINSQHLNREEQVLLLDDLQTRALKPELTAGVINLLIAFRGRDFVFGDIRDRIDAEIDRLRAKSVGGPVTSQQLPAPPSPSRAPQPTQPTQPASRMPQAPPRAPVAPRQVPQAPIPPMATKVAFSKTFMVMMVIAGLYLGITPVIVGIVNLKHPARRRQSIFLIVIGLVTAAVWIGISVAASSTNSGS